MPRPATAPAAPASHRVPVRPPASDDRTPAHVEAADALVLAACEDDLRRIRRAWRDTAAGLVRGGATAIDPRGTPDALTLSAAVELQHRLRPLALAALAASGAPRAGLLHAAPGLPVHVRRRTAVLGGAGDELLRRLAADAPLLRPLLGGRDLGPVVAVDGAGDPHAGGRRTSILRDASGAGVALKPRSLRPDLAVDGLLARVSPLAPGRSGPRLPPSLDRGAYGWQHLVHAAPCADRGAELRLAERCGVLLAVLHAVRAGDVHADNVVLTGEQIVPIDLECVLQPPLGGAGADPVRGIEETGLVPHVDPVHDRDLSPLGAWLRASGDAARGGDAGPGGPPSASGVGGRATEASGADFGRAFARGFDSAWDALDVEAGSPGEDVACAFADAPVRVIARPTMAYDGLLSEIATSDALGAPDAPAIRRRLKPSSRRPDLVPLVPVELADLLAGDVPRFTARAGSRDLEHSGATVRDVLRAGPVPTLADAMRSAPRPSRDALLGVFADAPAGPGPDAGRSNLFPFPEPGRHPTTAPR